MDVINKKPEPLKYPHQRIKYKLDGKTIELMWEKAKTSEEPERKQHMVQAIANFMKMAYVQWNKDSVADESIIADLRAMSGGQLQLEENVNLNKVEFRANPYVKENNARGGRTNNNNQNNRGRSNQNNNPRNNNNQNNRNRNSGGGSRKY